jgi:mannose-6-phosphate isomerase-like protein (cupin superfamily)
MESEQKVLVMELNNKPEYQKLLEGVPQTRGMRSGRVYLEPGKSCGQHSTKEHEEQLAFLAGRGLLKINETDDYEVSGGKIAYIPANTIHDVVNTSDKPLIYIYCVAPVT